MEEITNFYNTEMFSNDLIELLFDTCLELKIKVSLAELIYKLERKDNVFLAKLLNITEREDIHIDIKRGLAFSLLKLGCIKNQFIDIFFERLKELPPVFKTTESILNFGKKDKHFIHILVNFIKDKNIHNSIKENVARALSQLKRNDNEYIDLLVAIIIDETMDYSIRKSIVSSFPKSKENHYFISQLNNIIDNLKIHPSIENEIEIYLAYSNTIKFFFNEFEYNLISLEKLILIIQSHILPLYLKNKKLHTIENGKEISTQREVDEATLNEIKMLIKGDNFND